MAVNYILPTPESLLPVTGVTLGYAKAHVRKPDRKDMLVIALDEHAHAAGVFTQNRFCAAPVLVCREHLKQSSKMRALVINTGCANAGTGDRGLADARATCAEVAKELGVKPNQVLPFSTGVILEHLPMDKILAGIPQCKQNLTPNGWFDAAHAIMTTDTVPKGASRQIEIHGHKITVTGISKGAGMIEPNMATMLGFIATDAVVAQTLAQGRAKGRFCIRF